MSSHFRLGGQMLAKELGEGGRIAVPQGVHDRFVITHRAFPALPVDVDAIPVWLNLRVKPLQLTLERGVAGYRNQLAVNLLVRLEISEQILRLEARSHAVMHILEISQILRRHVCNGKVANKRIKRANHLKGVEHLIDSHFADDGALVRQNFDQALRCKRPNRFPNRRARDTERLG